MIFLTTGDLILLTRCSEVLLACREWVCYKNLARVCDDLRATGDNGLILLLDRRGVGFGADSHVFSLALRVIG